MHSPVATESLTLLFDKLSRKRNTEFSGKRVGPGWLKYEWSGSVWNLDDGVFQSLSISVTVLEPSTDGDYSIFQWRQNGSTDPPTVYLKNPLEPLPSQSSYRNPAFYLFHPDHTVPVQPSLHSASPSARIKHGAPHDSVPKHKKEFEDFHTSNGVRTITGSIGPVKNGTRLMIIFRNFVLNLDYSTHVTQDWISPCVYIPKVCHETQSHPAGCRTWALRV